MMKDSYWSFVEPGRYGRGGVHNKRLMTQKYGSIFRVRGLFRGSLLCRLYSPQCRSSAQEATTATPELVDSPPPAVSKGGRAMNRRTVEVPSWGVGCSERDPSWAPATWRSPPLVLRRRSSVWRTLDDYSRAWSREYRSLFAWQRASARIDRHLCYDCASCRTSGTGPGTGHMLRQPWQPAAPDYLRYSSCRVFRIFRATPDQHAGSGATSSGPPSEKPAACRKGEFCSSRRRVGVVVLTSTAQAVEGGQLGDLPPGGKELRRRANVALRSSLAL